MSHLNLTIAELHALYVSGLTTPLNVVNEVISALEKDENNILEQTMYEEARLFAASLKEVEIDNLLWGIPFLVKDNIATKGVETTGSSNILNGYVSLFDAEVIKRLKDQKAIPIAKTTMDELGMGGKGMTGHKGITINPYSKDKLRIVGGSSSGSASGVASGYVPFALASDTGDSIRKPASLAGLVGFKPTWGELSRYGLFAFMPTLDHLGFFSRSVYDASLLYESMRGYDPKDFTSNNNQNHVNSLETLSKPLKDRKIAVIEPVFARLRNEAVISEFNNLVQKLEEAGATVIFVSFDEKLLKAILPTYLILSCSESTASNASLSGINFGNKKEGSSYEEIVLNTRTEGFTKRIKFRFLLGDYSLGKNNRHAFYERAQKARALIVKAVNEVLDDFDVIMLPAAPSHAPVLNKVDEPNSEIENNYLAIGNLGGFPSLTIPFALDKGLPLGINITGKVFDDHTVLSVGYQIEQITNLYNLHAGQR
ncbi:MAG: amidase family protein [Bacilli bacterium]|nr:amidase family protein [Bacilli bacterium]